MQTNNGNDPLNDVNFESGTEDHQLLQLNQNNQQQLSSSDNNQIDGQGFSQGGASVNDGVYEENEDGQGIQNNMDQYGEGVEADQEGGDGEDEEGESVYMIDGVVMRMIQIEGEENQYLMDPQGRIYDM